VRLPLLPESLPNRQAETLAPLARPTSARKVLVVDDNVDAAHSVATLLQIWGHEIRVAHSGPDALQAAEAFQPDIVLLDIGLPGMSGYEVARQLRQQPRFQRTVLAAITGYGQEQDRRQSGQAGFDHHLTKPVAPATLQELMAVPSGAN
jgi:two-component system CheB/CheR fusion protein